MGNEETFVSVGLPVYNGENFIREALDSVLSQTYENFELIISDNCSTDNTESICREYLKKDARIKYYRHPHNRGPHSNLMYLLDTATGMYFTILCHDDALEDNFLEQSINYMVNHQECVLVSGDFEIINESGLVTRIDKVTKMRDDLEWPKRRTEIFIYPNSKICLLFHGFMKTEIIRFIFKTTPAPSLKILKGFETVLLSRIALAGQIVALPSVLRKYREHGQSVYNQEFSRSNAQPAIVRQFNKLLNIYQIRYKQLKIILFSNYPWVQKFFIIAPVYIWYLRNFLNRLVRIPKKFWLFLFKFKNHPQ